MTDNPFAFWTEQESAASFSEPGACQKRATAFEKVIRRRNAIEYAAGGLVVVLFGAVALMFGMAGEWLMTATASAVIVAAAFVMFKLQRDGSAQMRRPEQTCREHLRSQLVRQRDLLRGVPKWYLAPFVPGLLGFYLVVSAQVAERHGWGIALGGIWGPLAATAAFFVFLGWLNLYAAKKIDREIRTLDQA